jgi:hypothetical protein
MDKKLFLNINLKQLVMFLRYSVLLEAHNIIFVAHFKDIIQFSSIVPINIATEDRDMVLEEAVTLF